jgi:dephospho-CoA kinase
MIDVQMPSARKRSLSDFVIDNDGDEAALERAAAAVWRVLADRA